jgi:hypothetical protein
VLAPALREVLGSPRFWAGYRCEAAWFDDDVDDPVVDGCVAEFPAGADHALQVWLSHVEATLMLRHPGADEPAQLGWDDEVHWHPHVLRLAEADEIGRLVALDDPTVPHPGVVMVLLRRFVVAEDGDPRLALLREAYRAVGASGPGSAAWRELWSEEAITEQIDVAGEPRGARWEYDSSFGWYPVADEGSLCTLRTPGTFPAAAWNEYLAVVARRTNTHLVGPWREAVRRLAEDIVATGDLKAVPGLRRALVAAGCEHLTVLDALREPVDPARACWVVELLAGATPGTLLGRHFGPVRWPSQGYA